MIKPPFTAKQGISGVWLEDSNGVTVCDINPLIEPSEAFRIAELLARSVDAYMRQVEHARRMSQSPKVGRPPAKKPNAMALAKRKSRTKLKQQKPE